MSGNIRLAHALLLRAHFTVIPAAEEKAPERVFSGLALRRGGRKSAMAPTPGKALPLTQENGIVTNKNYLKELEEFYE